MPAAPRKAVLTAFFGLSWLHMLFHTWPYLRSAAPKLALGVTPVFHLLTWATYSFLYLAPALLLVGLCCRFMPNSRRAIALVAIGGTTFSLLFIQADRTIYDLYNFHFNGFVANLLFTPGGIESLGSGDDTYLSVVFIGVRTIAWQVALYWLSSRLPVPLGRRIAAQRSRGTAIAVAAVLLLTQTLVYGISDVRNDGAVLESAKVYPFYQRITFRGVAEKFGFKTQRADHINAAVGTGSLRYPHNPITYAPVARPPNIVMLVSESLRWDQLTPELMPNTWAFAQRAQYFTQHYSSGNGTREGLFGMFYGLYGSYWNTFLYAQQPPLLMERVQELGYQLDLRTSAHFTYPEFDKTLFANVPQQFLHDGKDGVEAWQTDQEQTDALLRTLAQRDPRRPFMSFLFYNSTHARYSFPDSAIVKRPYLEHLNYTELSKESLAPHIGELLNRYGNAAHWIDTQMGRVFAWLEQNDLLDNTIVIVTGDHGEEFMEKGFWGHNSSFVEQQTHTPMVVWMPGRQPARIDRLTSHMDISTTLLQQLGAPADARDYSLGRNLFDDSARPYIVISDWHSIAVRTADMNFRIPYINHGVDRWTPANRRDIPYSPADAARILEKNRVDILAAIKNCSAFYAGK